MNNNLDILISTSNDRIQRLVNLESRAQISYVILHQVFPGFNLSEQTIKATDLLEKRDDVTYLKVSEKGLSKSRNRALDASQADYALIADDDTDFDYNGIIQIIDSMAKDKVDIASGRHEFFSGRMAKNYPTSSYMVNKISAASISSVDMVLNMCSIRKHCLQFDERFGLGTTWPSGEEYIFINDALRKNLKVKFYPITLAHHPDEVSGNDFFSSADKVAAKREMFVRCFPTTHLLYRFMFWIKKLPIVVKNRKLLKFTRNLLWR